MPGTQLYLASWVDCFWQDVSAAKHREAYCNSCVLWHEHDHNNHCHDIWSARWHQLLLQEHRLLLHHLLYSWQVVVWSWLCWFLFATILIVPGSIPRDATTPSSQKGQPEPTWQTYCTDCLFDFRKSARLKIRQVLWRKLCKTKGLISHRLT